MTFLLKMQGNYMLETRSCISTNDLHLKRKLKIKNVYDKKDARISPILTIVNLELESSSTKSSKKRFQSMTVMTLKLSKR